MISARSLGSGLSIAGTLFQLAVVADMAPPDWCGRRSVPKEWVWGGHGSGSEVLMIWAPHMENLPEGRLGRRCPGRQPVGEPFRIDGSPLPEGYDPHAFPDADIIACVWLDERGVARKARLVGGTGSAALDRRMLRILYRQWSFAPAYGVKAVPGWQRIRLNSGHLPERLPEPGNERSPP